ncbi:MAG: hypothetical protein INQ03_20400 [Candidatus Heimdallarchaeota archaeon]|nr:hypothetical protein [Candidatus Heimdallarchaeota archaeon]
MRSTAVTVHFIWLSVAILLIISDSAQYEPEVGYIVAFIAYPLYYLYYKKGSNGARITLAILTLPLGIILFSTGAKRISDPMNRQFQPQYHQNMQAQYIPQQQYQQYQQGYQQYPQGQYPTNQQYQQGYQNQQHPQGQHPPNQQYQQGYQNTQYNPYYPQQSSQNRENLQDSQTRKDDSDEE